jgi:hypothetical protein
VSQECVGHADLNPVVSFSQEPFRKLKQVGLHPADARGLAVEQDLGDTTDWTEVELRVAGLFEAEDGLVNARAREMAEFRMLIPGGELLRFEAAAWKPDSFHLKSPGTAEFQRRQHRPLGTSWFGTLATSKHDEAGSPRRQLEFHLHAAGSGLPSLR